MLGFNNFPFFSNSLTTPSAWINQVLNFLSFTSPARLAERITTTPSTIIPGKIYVIGSPVTGVSPGAAGEAVVYLTTSPSSAVALNLPDGTVLGGWTRSGANWVRSVIVTDGVAEISVAGTYAIPALFDGACTIVIIVTGITLNPSGGQTPVGLVGTSLPVGVYTLYQSSTITVI